MFIISEVSLLNQQSCNSKSNLPSSEASAALLKFSRLTLGGRLGLAGAGPKAKLLGRGLRLGPEVASPLTLLGLGEGLDGFFKLGFLLAGGLGGVTELVAVRGGLVAPPLSGCSFLSLLNIF